MNNPKKLILISLVTLLTTVPTLAQENVGNKVNEKEFPQANSVLPDKPKPADFVIKAGVQKNIDLTLDKCIEIAMGNNPDINVAFHDVLASDTRIKQVWANYFPQLSWQTGYSKIKQLQLSDVFGRNLTFKYYILGQITLQQMLYDFGVTQNQATVKRIEYEGYKETLAGTINDTIYQTKDAYYQLLYAFEAKKVAQDNVKKFEMFYNQAKAFYEIGTNPKVDVTIAQVNLSNAKLQLIQADNNVNLAVAKLNNIMGVPFIDKYNVTERLKYQPIDITFDEAVKVARESRPELKLSELHVASAKQTVKLVKKAWYPSFSLSGQYERGGKTWNSNYGYNYGVYLNFPTVNGMLINQEIKEAKFLYDKQLASAKSTQNKIYLEIQQDYLNLEEKRQQMPVAQLRVKQAKENYELSYGRYRVGEANPTELKDAQLSYQDAQLQYYQAMYEYSSAKAALERAIGKNITDYETVEIDNKD